MFSSLEKAEIPLFSHASRVFARIFVQGAITGLPLSVGLDRGPF